MLARSFVALLGRIAVQGVVAVWLDYILETRPRLIAIARRVVGDREQEIAPNPAFREQGQATRLVQAIFHSRFARRLGVLADGPIGGCALGHADQHPIARGGRQPGPDLLFAIIVELEVHDDFATLCRRLELYGSDAAVLDRVSRFAMPGHEQLVFRQ